MSTLLAKQTFHAPTFNLGELFVLKKTMLDQDLYRSICIPDLCREHGSKSCPDVYLPRSRPLHNNEATSCPVCSLVFQLRFSHLCTAVLWKRQSFGMKARVFELWVRFHVELFLPHRNLAIRPSLGSPNPSASSRQRVAHCPSPCRQPSLNHSSFTGQILDNPSRA